MSSTAILYGPDLAPAKRPVGIKRQPCTWTLGFRAQAQMVDHIEALARQNGCKMADVLRTAVDAFLRENPIANTDNPATDQPSTQRLTQPHTATRYTGNGGSDHAAITAATNRQNLRKRNSQTGERLVDKASSR